MQQTDILLVTGLPRSGTSLMMQMLHAGGLPVFRDTDSWSYETEFITRLPDDSAWLHDCHGKVVKLLDPHRWTLPPGLPYLFIWMSRNSKQQAKSQVKFLKTLGQSVSSKDVPYFRKMIRQDTKTCLNLLKIYHCPILRVQFESVLRHPTLIAEKVSAFCGGLNVKKMASCVNNRPVRCLRGMMELKQ
jgi:hypothetical protein